MAPPRRPLLTRLLLLAAAAWAAAAAGDGCSSGCGLALGSYYISPNQNLTYISGLFGINDYHNLTPYNPAYPNPDFITAGQRVNVYFPCSCLALPRAPFSTYLAGSLPYNVSTGDTYTSIADHFNNLTTVDWLKATNSYSENNIPNTGTVNVTVNCSCGDAAVSKDYGLFLTHPLRGGETLTSVAANNGFSSTSQMDLLRKYNPGMDGVTGSGIVYIPVKDPSGSYRPLKSPGNGASAGAIAGGVVGVVVALLLGVLLYIIFYRRRKAKKATLLPSSEDSTQLASMDKVTLSTSQADSASPVPGITVDKSVEFSYEELFNATEGFSMSNKIGQGGFGAVYYAELRGEKAAIKKMDMKATNEFLAELKVLTHVHHLNLVRLIGYCIESSLFLVYEYIENGNLSQHLRRTGYEPLSWAARVQIALDSARGLEYIHEHTVPVYIHRDIKSANILIDKNYRAKVADFGLTKLTEVGYTPLTTRGVVGTFGYMPPEYAYGDVSPKVDVYAFGVVLYELISAKEAIVRSTESASDSKGLVYLFEEALNRPDPKEGLQNLIDPVLGEDYPIDSILKVTALARACTQEDPKLRPTMRSVVVALMTLSSTSELWDMNSIQENQGAPLLGSTEAVRAVISEATFGLLVSEINPAVRERITGVIKARIPYEGIVNVIEPKVQVITMDGFLELMSEQNIEDNGPYWDDSQFVSPHEEKQLPHVEAGASQKAKKARSKNFSVKEDNMLVLAWLEVSLDAIQGNEQSRATYWQRITDYFHENKDFASDRNSNSLQHRWSIILEGVNRFCGCYVQIQNRRQSGVTEQDKVMHACELYKSKDPKGRSFGLLHCWNILQHEQKWKDRCVQKKQKTSSTGSLSSTPETNESHLEDDGEGHTSEPVVRPGGRKAEKERQRRGKNPVSPGDNLYMEALENMWAKKKEAEALKEVAKKERYDERLALEKKKIELKEQDIALRRRIEDDKVMNMDLSGMSERQRQYYTSLQDEIIARRFGTGSG